MHIDIIPMPKPRMTQRDRWAKRPCIAAYWEWKDALKAAWNGQPLDQPHKLVFVLPMPQSWSQKRKASSLWTPHTSKPDLDNLLKAFYDALLDQDSSVWAVLALKVWGEQGGIYFSNIEVEELNGTRHTLP